MGSEVRVNNLAAQTLATTLSQLEQDLDELKSSAPQYVGGASVRNYISQTANQYDYAAAILTQDPLNPGNTNMGRANWLITATAQHSNVSYAQFVVYMYIGGSTTAYLPSNYLADIVGGIGFQTRIIDVSTNPANASNQKTLSLQITGDRTRTCAWKVYVIGLDTSTISTVKTL